MNTSLLFSGLLMFVFCCGAARLGYRVTTRSRGRGLQWAAFSLTLIGMLFYWGTLYDRPLLARLVPHPDLIVFANWTPPAACLFAGALLGTQAIPALRRVLFGGLTFGLSVYALVAPISAPTPRCFADGGGRDLVYQTTMATCSPAGAASLLRLHGISAGEAELTQLCLTQDGRLRSGTHWLGVFRGLRLKTQGTPWDVEVFEISEATLDRLSEQYPVLLCLTLDEAMAAEGFLPEAGHTVLSLGAESDGRLRVFDPAPDYGLETWDTNIIRRAERAIAFRLIPRTPSGRMTQAVEHRVRAAGMTRVMASR